MSDVQHDTRTRTHTLTRTRTITAPFTQLSITGFMATRATIFPPQVTELRTGFLGASDISV